MKQDDTSYPILCTVVAGRAFVRTGKKSDQQTGAGCIFAKLCRMYTSPTHLMSSATTSGITQRMATSGQRGVRGNLRGEVMLRRPCISDADAAGCRSIKQIKITSISRQMDQPPNVLAAVRRGTANASQRGRIRSAVWPLGLYTRP